MCFEMANFFLCLTIILLPGISLQIQAKDDIDMKLVRQLAVLPVNQILQDSGVEKITTKDYWSKIHGRNKPLLAFFYSNTDRDSQRLATLIKYVAPHYQEKLFFVRVQVAEKGKPGKNTAKDLLSGYSLNKTPGILFYDNVGENMVLEDEEYIDAYHKEYRTPGMFLWNTYYSGVRKELDKLLAD